MGSFMDVVRRIEREGFSWCQGRQPAFGDYHAEVYDDAIAGEANADHPVTALEEAFHQAMEIRNGE